MKKFLLVLIAVVLLLPMKFINAEELNLATNAKSAILIEASTGEIIFEKNSSEFKLIKYSFDENNITAYLNYVGIENCDSIEINNITYNYIKTNENNEYFIVSNDAIYVFSFTETSENDINEILNTVTYYK